MLLRGDLEALGEMLHEGWELKKRLASSISDETIDRMYGVALEEGAWGGKILGAGGGGCLMMLAPTDRREAIVQGLASAAADARLAGAGEVPVSFVQTGAEILFNSEA
jgi:D-glycero-alpha-D-manno-heptose-7-phosphate kinase